MTRLKALDESCLEYAGKLLFFKVHAGWGWQHTETDAPDPAYPEASGPPDCHLRVHDFFRWQGVWRGAIAKVEEPGHIYDGFWSVFYTRVPGTYNFTGNLTHYNIQIGPEEPALLDPSADPEIAEYGPLWRFFGSPRRLGFGMAAVEPQQIARWAMDHTVKAHRDAA